MTIGEQTIDWLYKDQLRIDNEWSIRTAKGFTWWADKYAQTVEVIGEELGPDGDTGYLISVRTDFLRNLELTPEPMPFIVDDVLLSFDEERASSALSVLNEMSAKTQVVFFTHHQHLVNLAESATQAQ